MSLQHREDGVRRIVAGVEHANEPPPLSITENTPPLVAHIIFRLDVGGLENGLVNLINVMPAKAYRHAIICLTDYTDFWRRIKREDVQVFSLGKRPGKDPLTYIRLWRLLRRLKPDIVHTRNIATLDGHLPAAFAGVWRRIHGEHGRDIYDLDGTCGKYVFLRRVFDFLVHRFITVSEELSKWLCDYVGIKEDKVVRIYNGVDRRRFRPVGDEPKFQLPANLSAPGSIVIGTVGRMEPVKDHLTLVKAFIELCRMPENNARRVRLVIVGDGSQRKQAQELLTESRVAEAVWLPGTRSDVPELLRSMDIFVLPSIAEGISNTVLEAMATGLPVVATRVGGNPELVREGVTGRLVPASDPSAMAKALMSYLEDEGTMRKHGHAGRERIQRHFSLVAMVEAYKRVYDELMRMRRRTTVRGTFS